MFATFVDPKVDQRVYFLNSNDQSEDIFLCPKKINPKGQSFPSNIMFPLHTKCIYWYLCLSHKFRSNAIYIIMYEIRDFQNLFKHYFQQSFIWFRQGNIYCVISAKSSSTHFDELIYLYIFFGTWFCLLICADNHAKRK